MTDKQIINSCEFQSRCIQYKDMYSNKHIKCPIVDFAIACRGENKCKYKTVYEQLKAKEQECEELKAKIKYMEEYIQTVENARNEFEKESKFLKEENKRPKQALAEIKEIAENATKYLYATKSDDYADGYRWLGSIILQKIRECEGRR